MSEQVDALVAKIRELHAHNRYHRRRGFRLNEGSPIVASNHLLEEVVELQAEVITGNRAGAMEEAGDALSVLIYLLHRMDIDLDAVAYLALVKLDRAFTNNPSEVLASKPTVTRRSRG